MTGSLPHTISCSNCWAGPACAWVIPSRNDLLSICLRVTRLMICPLEGASDWSVAVLHIKPTEETNVPIILIFVYVWVGHTTTTLIPLLLERHITGSLCPRELELLLSLTMVQTGHVICKWIPTAASAAPASVTSVVTASNAAGRVPCILVESPCIEQSLVGDCHTLNWWDIECRCRNGRWGAEWHCRNLLFGWPTIGLLLPSLQWGL